MHNSLIGFSRLLELFSSTDSKMLLLAGSGILVFVLVFLAVTRWGHSRPVWKCVILSVAAHILLIGYAYGTRLIFSRPAPPVQSASIHVDLVEDRDPSDSDDSPLRTSEPNWDPLASPMAFPELKPLERTEIKPEELITQSPTESTLEKWVLPKHEFHPELPAPETSAPLLSDSSQMPDLPHTQESPLRKPAPIEVARHGDGNSSTPVQPEFETPEMLARPDALTRPPAERHDPTVRTQAEIERDNEFVSDLVLKNAAFAVAPETLPAPAPAPDLETVQRLRPISRLSQGSRIESAPRRIADGQPLPKIYALRTVQDRLQVISKRGGSARTERAVDAGLEWLAQHQEQNGRWDPQMTGAGTEKRVFGHDRKGAGAQADSGITALATLAFLGAGHSHLEGDYKQEVLRGLEYIVRQQKSNGDLAGNARLFAKTYCHSMALLAISEAFAMTGDQRLRSAVQRGVGFSVDSQDPIGGGWRYQPGDSGDMSQFGWQVLALHSARLGGAVVPQTTLNKMDDFLESCSSGVGGGLASYRPRQGPSTTMTAESLMCRYFLDQNIPHATMGEATRRISSELPNSNSVNLYYWYYGTLAMYHAGGADWQRWNLHLKQVLLPLQERDGSWAPNGVWGGYGGRVYSTAMATLNLEVYYRYLPLFEEVARRREARFK